MKIKPEILFINLPSSFWLVLFVSRGNSPIFNWRIFLHSSVTMPASLLLHEEKSTQKPDETLIKK